MIRFIEAQDVQVHDLLAIGPLQREVTEARIRTLADGIPRVYIRTEGSSESIRHRLKFRVPVVAE